MEMTAGNPQMAFGRKLDPDLTTEELMRRWPQTVVVLIRHGMLCVGCPIAGFHTLTEACNEHAVDEEIFLRDLEQAIAAN